MVSCDCYLNSAACLQGRSGVLDRLLHEGGLGNDSALTKQPLLSISVKLERFPTLDPLGTLRESAGRWSQTFRMTRMHESAEAEDKRSSYWDICSHCPSVE